jgi:hypothetical protein
MEKTGGMIHHCMQHKIFNHINYNKISFFLFNMFDTISTKTQKKNLEKKKKNNQEFGAFL